MLPQEQERAHTNASTKIIPLDCYGSKFALPSRLVDIAKNKTKVGLVRASEEAERLVSAGRVEDDDSFELKLRPTRLAEFIGQEKAKEQLAIALEAGKSRGGGLDHVGLVGRAGLGEKTLGAIIGDDLGGGCSQAGGCGVESRGGLAGSWD